MTDKNFQYKIATFEEIYNDTSSPPQLLRSLDFLVRIEASSERQSYEGSPELLKERLIRKEGFAQGILVYAEETLPIAYCGYRFTTDNSGQKIAISENAFVTESFRPHNGAQVLFQALADKLLIAGAKRLIINLNSTNPSFHTHPRFDYKELVEIPKDPESLRAAFFMSAHPRPVGIHIDLGESELEALRQQQLDHPENIISIDTSAPIGPALRPSRHAKPV